MHFQPLRAWKFQVLIHMESQVLSLKIDMDAYMATLFGGEAWDLCYELGQAKKQDPILNPSHARTFA